MFDSALDSPEAKEGIDLTKQCFWVNLYNYVVLSRIFELLLVARHNLYKLENMAMFFAFHKATKVTVQGNEYSLLDIIQL